MSDESDDLTKKDIVRAHFTAKEQLEQNSLTNAKGGVYMIQGMIGRSGIIADRPLMGLKLNGTGHGAGISDFILVYQISLGYRENEN